MINLFLLSGDQLIVCSFCKMNGTMSSLGEFFKFEKSRFFVSRGLKYCPSHLWSVSVLQRSAEQKTILSWVSFFHCATNATLLFLAFSFRYLRLSERPTTIKKASWPITEDQPLKHKNVVCKSGLDHMRCLIKKTNKQSTRMSKNIASLAVLYGNHNMETCGYSSDHWSVH